MPDFSKYKVEIYDYLGNFLADVSSIAQVPSVAHAINNGCQMSTMNLAIDFDDASNLVTRNNEVRIYEVFSGTQYLTYSGEIVRAYKTLTDSAPAVSIDIVGYIGRLANLPVIDRGNYINFTKDGTTGNLYDSTPSSSNQLLYLVQMARFFNGNIGISTFPDTNANGSFNFGGARWLSQAFTTGTDSEVNNIHGFVIYAKWNGSGTATPIQFSIKADGGTGKPTGADIISGVSLPITNTSNSDIYLPFDNSTILSNSTKYHLIIRSTAAASTSMYSWNCDTSSNYYSGGDAVLSTNSGSTWTVQTNQDFTFQTIYVDGSKVRLYAANTTDDAADGASKVWTYTGMTMLDAINYVTRYAPAEFYFRYDETGTFHFHRLGFSKSVLINNCDAATGWTSAQRITGITTDTAKKVEGTGSVKFSLDGTGTFPEIYLNITAADYSSYKNIGPWIYVPTDTDLKTLYLRVWSNSQTNYKQWTINPGVLKKGAWNWLAPLVDMTKPAQFQQGTFDNTVVDRVSIVFETQSTAETSTWYMDEWLVGNLEIYTATKNLDIVNCKIAYDISELRNFLVFTNSGNANPMTQFFGDRNSIVANGIRGEVKIDARVGDDGMFNAVGNDYINKNASEKVFVSLKTLKTQELITARPGYLMRLNGFSTDLGNGKFFIITNMTINESDIDFELVLYGTQFLDKISELQQKVELLETYSATTGDVQEKTGLSYINNGF